MYEEVYEKTVKVDIVEVLKTKIERWRIHNHGESLEW